LADLQAVLRGRRVGIGRELTKMHESFVIRPITDWITAPPQARGEFVLVIYPDRERQASEPTAPDEALVAAEFWQMTNNPAVGRREALRAVATKFGIGTRDVFRAVERHPK
jgi:16S rRNA C1402 (ribose-2'-O) methylase RsmI